MLFLEFNKQSTWLFLSFELFWPNYFFLYDLINTYIMCKTLSRSLWVRHKKERGILVKSGNRSILVKSGSIYNVRDKPKKDLEIYAWDANMKGAFWWSLELFYTLNPVIFLNVTCLFFVPGCHAGHVDPFLIRFFHRLFYLLFPSFATFSFIRFTTTASFLSIAMRFSVRR